MIKFFYIVLKKWVFQAHRKVPPTTGVVHAFFYWKEGVRCILFSSYPLGCHQLSAAETHTWNTDEHHTFVNAMIAWNLATHGTHGGDPFVNFKLYSFTIKCSQKRVNLGTPFSFHKSDPKVIDVLFFLCRYPLAFTSLPLFFFLGCLFGLPSVISCRNIYIEYGCTWCICPYNDCLKFGNSWGYPFVQVKLPS